MVSTELTVPTDVKIADFIVEDIVLWSIRLFNSSTIDPPDGSLTNIACRSVISIDVPFGVPPVFVAAVTGIAGFP